jgi:hypothetical protein
LANISRRKKGIEGQDRQRVECSLQSPNDWEATYRNKNNKSFRGYVANLTETRDPENDLQLIKKVRVAPNHTKDAELLVEALPDLKKSTDLDTLYNPHYLVRGVVFIKLAMLLASAKYLLYTLAN